MQLKHHGISPVGDTCATGTQGGFGLEDMGGIFAYLALQRMLSRCLFINRCSVKD